MSQKNKNCPNYNHGKLNPPIQYCPTCGEKFKSNDRSRCNEDLHRNRLKERHNFCIDCGKKLRA